MGSPCVPDATTHTLLAIGLHDVLRPQQDSIRNLQQSQGVRDLGDVQHAAPEKRHLAAVIGGKIQNLLQTVDGRAEARNHQALLGAVEDVFQARPHGAFAFRIARAVDVGGIRHQQQYAALAVFGQRVQIEQLVVGGRGVHFEIAGVNDDAQRRGDGQRHGADDGVRDVDELDRERPDLHFRARLDPVQFRLVQQTRVLPAAVPPAPA